MTTYEAVISALADPTRRAILEQLRDGAMSVTELAEEMPVSRPAVSQHLGVLRASGLVRERKEGTRRYYEADPEGLAKLRSYLEEMWGGMLEEFGREAKRQARQKTITTKARRRR